MLKRLFWKHFVKPDIDKTHTIYVVIRTVDDHYVYILFTNTGRRLSINSVPHDVMSLDELKHWLHEKFKPAFYRAYGANYKMETYVIGEDDTSHIKSTMDKAMSRQWRVMIERFLLGGQRADSN